MASVQGRQDFLELEGYLMGVACLAAKRSRDPSTQENEILGVGFNRMPKGGEELTWNRDKSEEHPLENKYLYVCHAELNAIMDSNGADIRGSTIYVTLFPCNECAKLIIQAGISRVVYLSNKYENTHETQASERMLNLAGVQMDQFKPGQCREVVIDLTGEAV
ncbi:deoxycytidylate deaminase-like [Xyrichtys novacula]|nr:deoxycytidylate deaminase-like [Xyrichtys novacula]